MGLGTDEDGQNGGLPSALSAVTHASGALIMSGNAGAVTSFVGTALGAPVALAGAAASVVVVGGAIYLCSED